MKIKDKNYRLSVSICETIDQRLRPKRKKGTSKIEPEAASPFSKATINHSIEVAQPEENVYPVSNEGRTVRTPRRVKLISIPNTHYK